MGYKIIEIADFFVAGIATRTKNQDGHSQYDIAELWGKFMADQLAAEIPAKLAPDLYCVYTDYESDHTGYYTVVLGCRVSAIDEVPGGFIGIVVPGGKFRIYQPEGEVPQSVLATWQEIWHSDIKRSYRADFDVYYAGETTQARPAFKIYLGVI